MYQNEVRGTSAEALWVELRCVGLAKDEIQRIDGVDLSWERDLIQERERLKTNNEACGEFSCE